MRNITQKLKLLSIIVLASAAMWSCSYTTKTGGAKQFAKKHYNRGAVKVNKTHKDELVNESALFAEGLSRKEKKEVIQEKVGQFIDGQNLTAYNAEGELEYSEEAVIEAATTTISDTRSKLEVKKEEATSDKAKKQIDKKIERLEKLQNFTKKIASVFAAGHSAPGPEAASAIDGGTSDLLGLLGGIFGLTGFLFAFLPYIGFFGLLLCLAGIVLGALGLKGSNRGWAITGIVLGALGLLAFLLAIVWIFGILL